MIRKLGIRNFQNHRSLDLFLDKVNCLVGPSDCGKSAVLRAMIWGLTNRPLGAAFLTHGEISTKVTLLVDDDLLVREKGVFGNYYELNGDRYVAFAADIPEPVATCVNITPANIQQQHDPVFWFSDSPGVVSQSLNCIVDLGTIDDTLASLGRTCNETKAEVRATEKHRDEVSEKLAQVQHAQEMYTVFSDLDSMHYGWSQTHARKNNLQALLQEARLAKDAVLQGQVARCLLSACDRCAQDAIQARQRATDLRKLIQTARDANNRVAERPAMPQAISANYEACRAKRIKLKQIQQLINEAGFHAADIEKLQREKDALCQALPPQPEICPTCLQPIL